MKTLSQTQFKSLEKNILKLSFGQKQKLGLSPRPFAKSTSVMWLACELGLSNFQVTCYLAHNLPWLSTSGWCLVLHCLGMDWKKEHKRDINGKNLVNFLNFIKILIIYKLFLQVKHKAMTLLTLHDFLLWVILTVYLLVTHAKVNNSMWQLQGWINILLLVNGA